MASPTVDQIQSIRSTRRTRSCQGERSPTKYATHLSITLTAHVSICMYVCVYSAWGYACLSVSVCMCRVCRCGCRDKQSRIMFYVSFFRQQLGAICINHFCWAPLRLFFFFILYSAFKFNLTVMHVSLCVHREKRKSTQIKWHFSFLLASHCWQKLFSLDFN